MVFLISSSELVSDLGRVPYSYLVVAGTVFFWLPDLQKQNLEVRPMKNNKNLARHLTTSARDLPDGLCRSVSYHNKRVASSQPK
jgi:hypothetical protein